MPTDRSIINAKQFAGLPDGRVVPFCLVQGLIERWYLGKRMGADELLSVVPHVLFGCPHSFADLLNYGGRETLGIPAKYLFSHSLESIRIQKYLSSSIPDGPMPMVQRARAHTAQNRG